MTYWLGVAALLLRILTGFSRKATTIFIIFRFFTDFSLMFYRLTFIVTENLTIEDPHNE